MALEANVDAQAIENEGRNGGRAGTRTPDLLRVKLSLWAYVLDSLVGLFVFLWLRTASWALIEPYFEPYSVSLLALSRRRCVSSFLSGGAAHSALLESYFASLPRLIAHRFVSAPVGGVQP